MIIMTILTGQNFAEEGSRSLKFTIDINDLLSDIRVLLLVDLVGILLLEGDNRVTLDLSVLYLLAIDVCSIIYLSKQHMSRHIQVTIM